jgi:ParB-like chromosome segregation protein Spo0J
MKIENQYLEIDPDDLEPSPFSLEIYGEEGVDCGLVETIQKLGQVEPLDVIKKNGFPGKYIIVSGTRRGGALKKLGIKAKCRLVSFEDDTEMKEYIIVYNQTRKKNYSQKVNEANFLRPIYSKEAKERQVAGLKQNADVPNSAQRTEAKNEPGRTRDKVADAVGLGHDTLNKVTMIKIKADAGDEHAKLLMKMVDEEKMTPNAAYTCYFLIADAKSENIKKDYALTLLYDIQKGKITPEQAIAKLKRLQEKIDTHTQKKGKINKSYGGLYSVLFADFTNSSPPLENYMHLNLPSAKHSVLCFLTTTQFLKESHDIMDWWGFEYKSMCLWEQDIKSTSWFHGSHEFLILGTKGTWHAPKIENRFSSIIKEQVGHECVHEMIKKMFPGQNYIDLFPTKEHEGWDKWVLEEWLKFKELNEKLPTLIEELDRNESIKMILLGKKKEDGTQDVLEEWY